MLLQFGVLRRNTVLHILVVPRLTVIVVVNLVLIRQITQGTSRRRNIAFPPHEATVMSLVSEIVTSFTTTVMAVAGRPGVQRIIITKGKLKNAYSMLRNMKVLAIHRGAATVVAAVHTQVRHVRTCHTAEGAVVVMVVDASMGYLHHH
jgi:hypothetical protein